MGKRMVKTDFVNQASVVKVRFGSRSSGDNSGSGFGKMVQIRLEMDPQNLSTKEHFSSTEAALLHIYGGGGRGRGTRKKLFTQLIFSVATSFFGFRSSSMINGNQARPVRIFLLLLFVPRPMRGPQPSTMAETSSCTADTDYCLRNIYQ